MHKTQKQKCGTQQIMERTLVYRMQRERRQRVSWLQICWGHAQWVNGLFSAPCHESYGLQTLRK